MNAPEAAHARSLQSSDYSMQLDLPQCADYQLMCAHGNVGPLCGSCEEGFVFSSSARLCVNCQKLVTFIPSLLIGVFVIVALTLRFAVLKFREKDLHKPLILRLYRICSITCFEVGSSNRTKLKTKKLFWHFDRGIMLKVAWATFQILSTISWNLAVQYPEPFATALQSLNFMSMDFWAALKCSSQMNLMERTLLAALTPILFVFLNLMLYLARSARRRAESRAAFKVAERERAFRPKSDFAAESNSSSDAPRRYGSLPRPLARNMSNFSFFGGIGSRADHDLKAALERMRNQHAYFALVLSYLVTNLDSFTNLISLFHVIKSDNWTPL